MYASGINFVSCNKLKEIGYFLIGSSIGHD